MIQKNPNIRNKYLALMGLVSLVCLFYPVGTAFFPLVFIIDGIIGIVYGKKYGNRKFLAMFTFVLLVGVMCLPFFLVFIYLRLIGESKFD